MDGEGNQLGDNCNHGTICNKWATCLTEYPLGINRIRIGDTIKFTVVESAQVDAECLSISNHTYSINARMDLICESGTGSPSINPTFEPSNTPTSSTISPSAAPSSSPNEQTHSPTKTPTFYGCSSTLLLDLMVVIRGLERQCI